MTAPNRKKLRCPEPGCAYRTWNARAWEGHRREEHLWCPTCGRSLTRYAFLRWHKPGHAPHRSDLAS